MNLDLSFLTNALTIAIEVIALLEAIKVFFNKKAKQIPTWIYTVISFLFCFALSLIQINSFTWNEIKEFLPIGLLAFSLSQLFYDSVWKMIQKKIKSLSED